MNTYYLVRHGQSLWTTQGRTQGHGNSPLTELGKIQAINLARHLKE
ncbi:MAG: histidine phosphatase family protein, partial [Peptostreptococcus sp.]|nr:histidine phosphatase family protein [Peptostreptococcus sp.]